MTERFTPTDPDCNMRQFIGEAVGYATMAWDPRPTGVFVSEQGKAALDAILERVEKECAKHDHPQNEPLLGLATTGDLLSELYVRLTVPTPSDAASMVYDLRKVLSQNHLDYRTVDPK